MAAFLSAPLGSGPAEIHPEPPFRRRPGPTYGQRSRRGIFKPAQSLSSGPHPPCHSLSPAVPPDPSRRRQRAGPPTTRRSAHASSLRSERAALRSQSRAGPGFHLCRRASLCCRDLPRSPRRPGPLGTCAYGRIRRGAQSRYLSVGAGSRSPEPGPPGRCLHHRAGKSRSPPAGLPWQAKISPSVRCSVEGRVLIQAMCAADRRQRAKATELLASSPSKRLRS